MKFIYTHKYIDYNINIYGLGALHDSYRMDASECDFFFCLSLALSQLYEIW